MRKEITTSATLCCLSSCLVGSRCQKWACTFPALANNRVYVHFACMLDLFSKKRLLLPFYYFPRPKVGSILNFSTVGCTRHTQLGRGQGGQGRGGGKGETSGGMFEHLLQEVAAVVRRAKQGGELRLGMHAGQRLGREVSAASGAAAVERVASRRRCVRRLVQRLRA